MVRAKFKVSEKNENHNGFTVKLDAVYDADPNSENGKFFKWTPCATISLQTINESAANEFKVGKEFYVDFTEVING